MLKRLKIIIIGFFMLIWLQLSILITIMKVQNCRRIISFFKQFSLWGNTEKKMLSHHFKSTQNSRLLAKSKLKKLASKEKHKLSTSSIFPIYKLKCQSKYFHDIRYKCEKSDWIENNITERSHIDLSNNKWLILHYQFRYFLPIK